MLKTRTDFTVYRENLQPIAHMDVDENRETCCYQSKEDCICTSSRVLLRMWTVTLLFGGSLTGSAHDRDRLARLEWVPPPVFYIRTTERVAGA